MEAAALTHSLQERFGLPAFRPGQLDVISAVLAGRDTLAVMPTGQGKSLCYQFPALAFEGVTLVVSPLIALMKDQVDALKARGISATFINSSLDWTEQDDRMRGLEEGTYKLVYVAPERFRQAAFLESLKRARITLLAIDEAHCISEWGHDFRPDYRRLADAIVACGRPPVLAATATATPEVRRDIVAQLGLQDPEVVVSGFDRPNLRYVVRFCRTKDDKRTKLLEILEKVKGPAIVYAATRRNVEEVATVLRQSGISAIAYHAGLEDAERSAAQEWFMAGQVRTVVATNAFGMGIDKPDVRAVVHYDIPGTLEAYYQEAGRAGRDGRPSFCVLLYHAADRKIREFFIDKLGENESERPDGSPADPAALERRKEFERQKLKRVVNFAYSERCRRNLLLHYFGENKAGTCDRCDVCSGQADRPGEPSKAPPSRSERGPGKVPVLSALAGKLGVGKRHGVPAHPEKSEGPRVAADLEPADGPRPEADPELLTRLRDVRLRLAKEQQVPAFVVLHDRTLEALAIARPGTVAELLAIKGLGPAKVERYGEAFLDTIRSMG